MMSKVNHQTIVPKSSSILLKAGGFLVVVAAHFVCAIYIFDISDRSRLKAPAPSILVMVQVPVLNLPRKQKLVLVHKQEAPKIELSALASSEEIVKEVKSNQGTTSIALSVDQFANHEQKLPSSQMQNARSEAKYDADYLMNPVPTYPLMSRRHGESGVVLLFVQVTSQGLPEKVELQKTSGYPRLDEAALSAVRRWRFIPARQGNEAIASSLTIPLNFKLNS